MDDSIMGVQQNKGVKRSDALLEQVFPKHVAEALKSGKKVWGFLFGVTCADVC